MSQIHIPTSPADPKTSFLNDRDREPDPYDPPPPPREPKDDFGPPNMDPHGDGEGGKDSY